MKKAISIILMLTIVFSLFSVPCYASDDIFSTSGDISSPNNDSDSSNTNDDISTASNNTFGGPYGSRPARPEVIAEWRATHNEAAELAALRATLNLDSANATWINLYGFTYYAQELCDTCGPATVRMTLRALTGSAPTESAARIGCNWVCGVGTYMVDCTDYLNDEQSVYTYYDMYSTLKDSWDYNLYSAINDGAPAIVGIAITVSDGWFYDTCGHAISIYGVMSDISKYMIADPWGGYVNQPTWQQYTKSSSALWEAYDSNQGYIA